jgi:DmsE family decaheme c-type cytochrome
MAQGAILKFAVAVVLLMGGLVAGVAANDPAVGDQPNAGAASARMNQPYSEQGEKTCLNCHNSHPVDYILQTPMAVKGDPRTPFGQQGCESCHGPAGDHAQGKLGPDGNLILPPILFSKPHVPWAAISPVGERNAVCLNCHESGLRMNWKGSPHQNNDIACTSCHTVHATKDPVLVRATQFEKCFSCHAQQQAESLQYSHHPVREGKVACSDCHNPHGSPGGPHQVKEFTVNETCYNCHAEKRGPFLWEHQPVREDCTICHNPHGSNQPRLMLEPTNFICSSCHSDQSNNSGGAFGGRGSIPFHSQIGSTRFSSALANQRTCVNCHSQIHGSNSSSGTYFFR